MRRPPNSNYRQGVYGLRLSLTGYQSVDREVTSSPQKSQAVEVTLQRGS